MRVAYLITAYRDLQHLKRLCAALRREDPSCLMLVQFDVGSPLASSASELDLPVALTREPIRWGDGTYVRAVVHSLRMLADEPWDWVLVLSGQDYPIRPLAVLHHELEQSGCSAYSTITGRLPGDPSPPTVVERYTYRYVWARRGWPRLLRAVARRSAPVVTALSRGRLRIQPRPRGDGPGLGVRRRSTIFSERRPCYLGSDYVAMRRDSARALLTLLDDEPEVLDYFASTFVPSEALFASILRWIDPDTVANRNFHFMRFSGRANPRRITKEDLPELWELGMPFARKFDDDSAWVDQVLPMRGRPA